MEQLEIVYWRGSVEPMAELIRALGQMGFPVKEISTFEQLLDYSRKRVPGVLLVDGSAGEREASARALELADAEPLFKVPVIFLSLLAEKKTVPIKKRFSRVRAIEAPFNVSEVVEKVTELLLHSGSVGDVAGYKPLLSRDSSSGGQENKATITLPKSKLINRDPGHFVGMMGGKVLATGGRRSDFDDQSLIPTHPNKEAIKTALSFITEGDEWLGLHARRVSFVSASIASSLSMVSERISNIAVVSLLLNWGLLEATADIARYDPFRDEAPEKLIQLAKGFRRSGTFVKQMIVDEQAEQTIYAISDLLMGASNQIKAEILRDAECVLVVELSDRGCWTSAGWDPHGANRVFRSLRNKIEFLKDGRVAGSIIKALGEAVCFRRIVADGPASTKNEEKAANPIKTQDSALKRKLYNVHISDLSPGLGLAEPILTKSGQVLVEAGVELDEDLITRIWQLAAISSVSTLVTVYEVTEQNKAKVVETEIKH